MRGQWKNSVKGERAGETVMKARGLWKNSEESERIVEEEVRLIELLN